ncbi:MAG: hypothetical protein HW377_538, partial [Actinobacteria bacterium]|nr:hypothetical protein [Actinomycetota bacterium]
MRLRMPTRLPGFRFLISSDVTTASPWEIPDN